MVYNPRITGIALVTIDLGRACAFYEQALGFDLASSARYDRAEIATLRLGQETLSLVRPDRLGRAYPEGAGRKRSLVPTLRDCGIRRRRRVRAPLARPVHAHLAWRSGPAAAEQRVGDRVQVSRPDGHPLELSQFPDDRWTRRRTSPGPFGGIDHTAVAVADLELSLAFYSGTLGFELQLAA